MSKIRAGGSSVRDMFASLTASQFLSTLEFYLLISGIIRVSNTKTTKAISYKAKMGSKKLDSFFGKEDSVVPEEKEEEKKKE